MSEVKGRIDEPNDVPGFLRISNVGVATLGPTDESILQEAHRLTHGPRQADYSHPLDDYTRTAALVNAALAHKLRVNLDPEDVTIIMALVKISRQMHKPKRDNMVDLAGYGWCTDEIIEERARRAKAAAIEVANKTLGQERAKLSGEKP